MVLSSRLLADPIGWTANAASLVLLIAFLTDAPALMAVGLDGVDRGADGFRLPNLLIDLHLLGLVLLGGFVARHRFLHDVGLPDRLQGAVRGMVRLGLAGLVVWIWRPLPDLWEAGPLSLGAGLTAAAFGLAMLIGTAPVPVRNRQFRTVWRFPPRIGGTGHEIV